MKQKVLRIPDKFLFAFLAEKAVVAPPPFIEGADKSFYFTLDPECKVLTAHLVKRILDKKEYNREVEERIALGVKKAFAKKQVKVEMLACAPTKETEACIVDGGDCTDIHGMFKQILDQTSVENGPYSDLRVLWEALGSPCLKTTVCTEDGWQRVFSSDANTMATQSVADGGKVISFKSECTYSLFYGYLVISLDEGMSFSNAWEQATAVLNG
jgi:hypothetical protein